MQASSALPQTHSSIGRDQIAVVEQLIRPYVRHTPIIAVDARDFDLDGPPLVMKLELLQHTGSFKPRGAFANLLPELSPTLHDALAAGRPIDAPAGGIAADSLAPRRVGELMFPIARNFVGRSVLVSENAIRSAQRALWAALRLVAEPGGGTALAALLSGAYQRSRGERVAVLLCGANTAAVDFDRAGG